MNTALIAVDCQWDYYNIQGARGTDGSNVALLEILDYLPKRRPDLLIASRSLNDPDTGVCVKGTKGANIHPSIAKADYVVTKFGVSAFEGGTLRPLMHLEDILKEEAIKRVIVVGYYLEDAVAQTAFDANALAYQTEVYVDACQPSPFKTSRSKDIIPRLENAGVRCYGRNQ